MRTLPAAAAAVTLALGLAAGAAVAGEPVRAGDLAIADAYARASMGRATSSAAYMTIEAVGDAPDRLVAAASPAARAVELHTHLMEGGVARMRPAGAIAIEPGAPTVLQPGGPHLMVIGLREPLAEGDSLPLTLTFERNGEVALDLPVRGRAGGHGGHNHGGGPPSD